MSAIWDDIDKALAFAESPNFQTVMKDIATVNWKGLAADLRANRFTLADEEQTLQKALQIAGVFFPPAAIAANDLSMLWTVIQFAMAVNQLTKPGKPHWSVLPGPPMWVE